MEAELHQQFIEDFRGHMRRSIEMWYTMPVDLKIRTLKMIFHIVQGDISDLLKVLIELGYTSKIELSFPINKMSEQFINDPTNLPNLWENLSLLQVAVHHNSYDCLKLLLENEADISPAEHILTKTYYHHCDIELLKLLLEYGADPNELDEDGIPLLCDCAQDGSVDELQLLLANGASVHVADIGSLSTPLHFVAMKGSSNHYKCACILLEHGANPNACNRRNETPAFVAGVFGRKVFQLLIDHRGTVNAVNSSNSTAVHQTFMRGDLTNTMQLIEFTPDLNIVNQHGYTILDLAFRYHDSFYIKDSFDDSIPVEPAPYIKQLINGNAKLKSFNQHDIVNLFDQSPHKIEMIGLLINSIVNNNVSTHFVSAVATFNRQEVLSLMSENGSDERYLEFYDRFYNVAYRPRSLKHHCRCVIRDCIGRQFTNVVPLLDIPVTTKSYLLLDDPCDLN
ncbi:ankyrin repeat and SOCS box protein 18-like [Glandiceps talaboti]